MPLASRDVSIVLMSSTRESTRGRLGNKASCIGLAATGARTQSTPAGGGSGASRTSPASVLSLFPHTPARPAPGGGRQRRRRRSTGASSAFRLLTSVRSALGHILCRRRRERRWSRRCTGLAQYPAGHQTEDAPVWCDLKDASDVNHQSDKPMRRWHLGHELVQGMRSSQ